MVDPTRRIATAFYLITIFFTFFVVFYEKIPDDGRVGIIILCVFVQWVAAGKSKVHGAFVLNRRVALHAIDATPARWRGDGGSSLLDGASTAASSPSNDSTQVDRDALVHDILHPLRAGLGLHVLLPGAARLLQEAWY